MFGSYYRLLLDTRCSSFQVSCSLFSSIPLYFSLLFPLLLFSLQFSLLSIIYLTSPLLSLQSPPIIPLPSLSSLLSLQHFCLSLSPFTCFFNSYTSHFERTCYVMVLSKTSNRSHLIWIYFSIFYSIHSHLYSSLSSSLS